MKRSLVVALVSLVALVAAVPAAAQEEDDYQCSQAAGDYSSGGAPGTGAANDPLFAQQWGLTQVKAPQAWARTIGAGATIAIADTGVDLTHPDLQAKLLAGAEFVPSDAEEPGKCSGPQDENGHGTHVAGIAGAITNNGVGVAGTAPDAPIMPVRVLDVEGGGEDPDIIEGVKWAADNGAKVINLSLGGLPIVGQLPDSEWEKAVDYAFERGAVVVGAAGNESFPACSYPGAAKRAICVAATDRRGAPTFYSNFPADPDGTIAVRAPGGSGVLTTFACEFSEDIWSTIWPDSESDCKTPEDDPEAINGYDTLSGTSMAAPYVSGVAALLAGQGLSPAQILECIKTKSSNRGSYNPVMGWGIVDADLATKECSAQSTPGFVPPPGGGGTGSGGSGTGGGSGSGGQQNTGPRGVTISVRMMRVTAAKLVRTGRLRAIVSSSAPAEVRLRAVLRRRSGRRLTAGRKTVALRQAGEKRAVIRLSRRARRILARRGARSLTVRWSGAGQRGVATRR